MQVVAYRGRPRLLQSISQCDIESHPQIFRKLTKLKKNENVYNLIFNQVNVLSFSNFLTQTVTNCNRYYF